MRQYLDAKQQHRDAILLFRMGDFYEMFYEDALVAARALDLTLTSRSKDSNGGGIPMFGRRTKPNMEIGEDVVSPYLWGRSIRRIDVLALTHAHEDHIGGLSALMENFHVKELWAGAMSDNPLWDALRDQARRSGARIVAMQSGRSFAFGGAQVEVLSPAADYVAPDKPGNNDSLVMRLAYGRNSFLLTGDMERQIEARLSTGGHLAHADVLKVPHHGSKTSSTADFLDLVRPEFAIISDGFENSYGHPHADVLARLEERGARVLRTDRDGLVSIRSDGRRLYVDTGSRQTAAGTGLYGLF